MAWEDVTNKYINGTWRKILKKFVHNFKGFGKYNEVAKIIKAVVEMMNNFHLGMDEDYIEELLEVASEKLTNEEWLELE